MALAVLQLNQPFWQIHTENVDAHFIMKNIKWMWQSCFQNNFRKIMNIHTFWLTIPLKKVSPVPAKTFKEKCKHCHSIKTLHYLFKHPDYPYTQQHWLHQWCEFETGLSVLWPMAVFEKTVIVSYKSFWLNYTLRL